MGIYNKIIMLKTFKHIKKSKLQENKSNYIKVIHFDENLYQLKAN